MLYNQILKEQQRIQKQISSLQDKLVSYPEGKLICCHHRNLCKWYRSDGHSRTYIPKTNRILAQQLASKKYYSYTLKELLQEQKALNSYLKHHLPDSKCTSKALLEIPGYKELLSPLFKPLSQHLSDWASSPYEQNLQNPENLIHKTSSGHLVRSKSEAMIAHFLYINQIPFRYECALQLNRTTLFPDFTIRHPVTGETFYWEHFGLMDDPSYCKNAASKIQLYSIHDIIPSIQLITTYETQKNPLSTDTIQRNIEQYFL